MGNVSQGTVIPGQVQGVKQGTGVVIASDGTISFDSETSAGVVRTNNEGAFNGYIWPSSTVPGSQLTLGSGGNLSWIVRLFGFGLDLTGTDIKVSLPVGTSTNVPPIGSGLNQAIEGSLYWNNESDQLFICIGGAWVPASYGPLDLNEALLTGTYTLYVNPEIGSDIYVTGIYNPDVTPVVTNQMVAAGYSPQRPFKTLQRAALEVARFQGGPQPDALSYDRFVIKCSTGEHIIDNTPGSTTVTPWDNDVVPSATQLRAMNNDAYAGIILPRGVSVIGEDLRKTIIRPTYVPDKSGNIETDRGSILRITGGGFFFNFTFKDKLGLSASHHLLDCFSFVSDTDLVNYYSKVRTIFEQDFPDIPVNPGETEIVAPQPPGTPTEATDGILGSSPYIFNCSVRSNYGICGINADGEDVSGFKSLVTAQFTGVSLQRDLYCWQQYNQSTKVWENTISSYNGYVTLDPNSLRMDPNRKTYHIRAINGAFIQEVSVFAIGQGIHHWVKGGGEISITNSNSSFGGAAALAEGYKTEAFPQDLSWNVGSIRVATNMVDQTTVVSTVALGVVANSVANNSTTIVLTQPLVESEVYLGTPQILASRKYSFKPGSYLWIENSVGPDWRAPLTSAAWDPDFPDMITITVPMENQDGDTPGQDDLTPDLAGSRVYIRRLLDNRTTGQRKYSLELTNTDINVRTPPRDYVIQTAAGVGGGVIQQISDSFMTIVNQSGPVPVRCADPVVKKSQIVLGRSNPSSAWVSLSYYRPGDTVRYLNKHYTCVVQNSDLLFDPDKWSESYVHMSSEYNAYDFALTVAPTIYFDNDTDGFQPTATCGFNLATCWDLADIRAQYTTTTDYRGVWYFLIGMGFTDVEAFNILKPRTIATRELNPASSVDMLGYVPDGAANSLGNWPVEFRRPSVLRMFGHAWEWAGYLNYTKALPRYQGELSAQNQFNYYFTNNLGGRVYATGFNQEGYFVTAAGLTDLGTGSTIGITDIGNPFSGVDIPTYYPYLKVDNLEVTTTLNLEDSNITGSPTFDSSWYTNFRQASTAESGIIRIATDAEAKALFSATTAITPATLSAVLNATIKPIVNARLSLSASSPVPNTNQLNSANIFIHPYNGNEISLYDTGTLSWQVISFSSVLARSLAPASSANTTYDVYIYNAGSFLTPNLQLSYVAWGGPLTPPTRGVQDGIVVRSGLPGQRLMGVVRTTTAGISTYDLGGVITGANSADFPRVYLANFYNLYDFSARYFFGNLWDVASPGWNPVPASVYPVAPRISWVQATDSLVTAFLDLYSNYQGLAYPTNYSVAYVAPGIDTTSGPPDDAFYGETIGMNDTVGSQWARTLVSGQHDIYYLYKLGYVGSVTLNNLNEHPAHGLIVTGKV